LSITILRGMVSGDIMVDVKDLDVKENIQWCPGCGNHGLIGALKSAIAELGLQPHETVIASGIGCSSKLPHYVNTYGFEGIHGRPLPVASAVKLANNKLNVIAVGGDGDGYGIGVQHFVHIMRRNYDLTYIVHDNQIYGLTTGQASPTSLLGMKTKTTPWGVIERPFKPIAVAINGGATYVARGFAGDPVHLKELFKGAMQHKGFAFVDVFQPCVTFNKLNTYEWFQKRIYKLEEHDVTDRWAALKKAYEDSETEYKKVPIGVFYKVEKPTYESLLPQIKDKPLVEQDIGKTDLTAAYKALE
jgi:2-oxoglutarate ferredoxin oxidoreductase subunit beta